MTNGDDGPTAGKTTGTGDDPTFAKMVQAVERKCGLKPGQGLHTYFITVNNPVDHYPECEGKTPEEIVDWALAHCLRNQDGALRKSRGATICFERGQQEHTDHLHIALSFTGRNGGKAATVLRLWPTADIERAEGTVDQINDYLAKTGEHADKDDTTVVAPKHDGEPLLANPRTRQGGSKDNPPDPDSMSKRDLRWQALRKAVREGRSETEIWSDDVLGVYAAELNYPLQKLLQLREEARRNARLRQRVVKTLWVQTFPGASVMVTEIAIRRCLAARQERYQWGEWRLGAIFQPGVCADTDVLFVDARMRTMESDEELERLVSGAPLQVPTGWNKAFWATWTMVVVLTNEDPSPLMVSTGHPCRVNIRAGNILENTVGLLGKALSDTENMNPDAGATGAVKDEPAATGDDA